MTRRLLNFLTLLSLLLWAAACVGWVRSYLADPPDRLGLGPSFVVSSDGGVGWNYWSGRALATNADDWQFLGFGCHNVDVVGRTLTEWRVPYWFLSAATAALPVAWLVRSLRRPGRDRGFQVTARRPEAEGR